MAVCAKYGSILGESLACDPDWPVPAKAVAVTRSSMRQLDVGAIEWITTKRDRHEFVELRRAWESVR